MAGRLGIMRGSALAPEPTPGANSERRGAVCSPPLWWLLSCVARRKRLRSGGASGGRRRGGASLIGLKSHRDLVQVGARRLDVGVRGLGILVQCRQRRELEA